MMVFTSAQPFMKMDDPIKIAFLVRVPRWYSFRGDRLTSLIQKRGHEVVGTIVEPVASGRFLSDLDRKFGASMLVRKIARAGLNWLHARNGRNGHGLDGTAVHPPVYPVHSHNSARCAELLRSLAPDIVFLRGCGIIKREILEIPRIGVLNAHYGTLPKYRGVYATEWAILHGDQPAVTMHFVNEGVDSGDILGTRPVPLRPGATLASLRDDSARIGGELLADVLDGLQRGTIRSRKQAADEGVQYFSMHPRIHAVAERKLRRRVSQ
jgi:methionyl-tRNA formyltransferase